MNTLDDYRQLARRTRSNESTFNDRLYNWSLSLVEEAGETAGAVKKFLFHKHNSEWVKNKVIEELGDLMWYADALMEDLGISWEEVLNENIAKLKRRYPDGFSSEASQNRVAMPVVESPGMYAPPSFESPLPPKEDTVGDIQIDIEQCYQRLQRIPDVTYKDKIFRRVFIRFYNRVSYL